MSEKPESEEFEDEGADGPASEEPDIDLDQVVKDLDLAKRRGGAKTGDPAWRRLEKRLEEKQTAELTSDFDDYDIEGAGGPPDAQPPGGKRKAKR
ncbi:MAG: hypothetical protein ACREU3_15410 [Steroidobacteraceae bacterium]